MSFTLAFPWKWKLHKYRNNRKMKNIYFFQNRKKITSPANEFLLHKCRKNRKTEKYIFF